MSSHRWLLLIEAAGSGRYLKDRACTTPANAKAWARRFVPQALEANPDVQKMDLRIFDPHGKLYATAKLDRAKSNDRISWTSAEGSHV